MRPLTFPARSTLRLLLVLAGLLSLLQLAAASSAAAPERLVKAKSAATATMSARPSERQAKDSYAQLPATFIPNRGQLDARVRFHSQGGGYSFYFTKLDHITKRITRQRGTMSLRLSEGRQ
ncbi:MAG: hypothetical protein H0U03_10470 [Actinobacteria bacterium]|nr:hypothetical protein [Actinomycetota bacterium]